MTNWPQWDGAFDAFTYQDTTQIDACLHCGGGDRRRVWHTSILRATAVGGHWRDRPQPGGGSIGSRKVAPASCRSAAPGANPERRPSLGTRSGSGLASNRAFPALCFERLAFAPPRTTQTGPIPAPLNTCNNDRTVAAAAPGYASGEAGVADKVPLFRNNRLRDSGLASSSSSARKTCIFVTASGGAKVEIAQSFQPTPEHYCRDTQRHCRRTGTIGRRPKW